MKIFFSYLLILLTFYSTQSQDLNEPLLISGRITNSTGTYINRGDLHIQVYLKGHPDYFLTERSLSCGYEPPVWYMELGNLSIEWNEGDILIILIEDYHIREQIRFEWKINSTGIVPDLITQAISAEQEIYNFSISDRGVLMGIPLNFTFNTIFGQPTDMNLLIIGHQGTPVFESDLPMMIEGNKFQFSWDGRSQHGDFLRSGIYFYFLSISQKVVHSGLISLKND